MTDLARAITTSRELAVWIADRVGGVDLVPTDRKRCAAALISVCMWHHSSISQLLDLGRSASALALVRSVIECFARALWVAFLASDEDIEGFIGGDDGPSALKIMDWLEQKDLLELGTASVVLRGIWPTICDFNHGGGRMVVRHLTPTDIGPVFDDAELKAALQIADRFVLGAACAFADLIENRELGQLFLDKIEAP